jgi:hypothetical protein
MTDYDKRQYAAMLEQLAQFESKQIDLKHLISALESLLCLLEKSDADWKATFQSRWGVLEEVYADVLDRGYKNLPDSHQKLVEKSVHDLKAMIESALHANP